MPTRAGAAACEGASVASNAWMRERINAWKAAGRPTPNWQSFRANGSAHSPHVRPPKTGTPTAEDVVTSSAPPTPVEAIVDQAADQVEQLPDGKVPGWSREDLAVLSSAAFMLLLGITTLVASWAREPELAMTTAEAQGIAGPAVRIVARRIKVKAGARGDFADGAALAMALAGYATRVFGAMSERARQVRAERSSAVFGPGQPAPTANGAVPPVDTGPQWPDANQVWRPAA